MSSILGLIARFIDEKLSAARVLIGLLLLTLVTNGSLLLAQYGPPSGFDAPMPLFDAASGPEESGEPVPNGGALAEGRSNGGALAEGRSSTPPPSPSGIGRSSTVTRASGTLAAGDAEGGRDSGSTSNEAFTLPQSTELLGAVSSSGLPSVLRELVPDSLGELVPDNLEDLIGRGVLNILSGEDAQANEDSQGGGGPPADEGPQGSGGSPADEGPQGSGGPPSSVDSPASGGPQDEGGPKDDGEPKGDGGPPSSVDPKGDGGPKDKGGPKGDGGPQGNGGPKDGGGR